MHITDAILSPVRERYGTPARLDWTGELTRPEYELATYNPARRHDVTLFIVDPGGRLLLVRKPPFGPGIWRTPGGGVKPGEDFAAGAIREAVEETGLQVTLDRYLVDAHAHFGFDATVLEWRTHVLSARAEALEPQPQDDEIAEARWGTPAELAGPVRERLLETGRALWRYRVALHDAALAQLLTP